MNKDRVAVLFFQNLTIPDVARRIEQARSSCLFAAYCVLESQKFDTQINGQFDVADFKGSWLLKLGGFVGILKGSPDS